MSTVLEQPTELTLTDLHLRFGAMPSWRIRCEPAPGTATEADLLAVHEQEKVLCELVDGVLVEKLMGYEESLLAVSIIVMLKNFSGPKKLGVVAGEGGMLRISPGLVRIPDVSFIGRSRLPGGKPPRGALPVLVPNLAVEVLSKGNTAREMSRKLADYFGAGVDLVWLVDPRTRTVKSYTSLKKGTVLKGSQLLTGGTVLPGFKVRVAEIFSVLDEL
jgi:Uma2 family endonuclease